MKLIVGLGNPGRAYTNSRHNVGFRCVSHFARLNRIPLARHQQRARVGAGVVAGTEVVVAKPRTFMNLSGEAVARLASRFGVPLEDLIVIHDDMDLPLGKVRIRLRGSSAGHNGIQSIMDSMGSRDFARIRVGIGRPDGDEVTYVLSDFTAAEKEAIEEAIATVSDAIRCILAEGIEAAMNRYN